MVLIVGHRGARNLWPENSLDGFRRTRALGVDAVEFDVHQAARRRAGRDPRSDARAHHRGAAARWSSRTAAELAATKLRDGGGEGVPTLDAVLDVFAGTTFELHIEIKTDALGKPLSAGWSSA